MRRAAVLLALFASQCAAQRVVVYSPFTRLDPQGNVYPADRGTAEPRHILSPGIPRNGVTPLRVVVEFDKPQPYWLEIAQNPEKAVNAKLYRENFVETSLGFVPDTLQEVSNPYRGFAEDFRLPGQKVVTFWLEMGVSKNAAVDRVKVEPQLYADGIKDWIVYPMEVRIQSPVLPDSAPPVPASALPPLTAPADATIFPVLCPGEGKPAPSPAPAAGQLTGRELLRRYVAQDLGLVANRARLDELFQRTIGSTRTLKSWCEAPQTPPTGPEWYLKLRDAIYRASGAGE